MHNLSSQPRNKRGTLLSISARGVRKVSRRNSKSTITALITSRAEDLDFAGVDAGEGLLLERVSEGHDSLSFAISFLSSLRRPRGLGDGW